MQIPHGFQPVSLGEMLRHLRDPMPMLGLALAEHLNLTSIEAAQRIKALEQKGLVQFAIGGDKEPSVFVSKGSTEDEQLFLDRLVAFWDVQGKFNPTDGRIESAQRADVVRISTPEGDVIIVASVATKLKGLGLITVENGQWKAPSKAQVMVWTKEHGICDFCSQGKPDHLVMVPDFDMSVPGLPRSEGGWAACDTCYDLVQRNRRKDLLQRAIGAGSGIPIVVSALRGLHIRFWTAMDAKTLAERPKLPPPAVPHWQTALDQRFNAINQLKFIERLPSNSKHAVELGYIDLKFDLLALRAADVYSFNADTMHAILVASQSIPHESPLKAVEIPSVRAGWFWFAEPLPFASSPIASETTAALLWAWDEHAKKPAIVFSAYVVDEKNPAKLGHLLPSTKWVWPMDMSFHQMLGLNTLLYRKAYGAGGPFEHQDFLIGEETTIKIACEMSLFFMQACLWFRQTVPGTKKRIDPKLIQTDGHVERHARKRYMRDHDLTEVPKVRVIALRKSAATAEPHEPGSTTGRHLHVRFVVSGHARLQPYGPGRTERKLIWIDAHVRGPENAPFKESGPKVFSVIR